MTLHAIPLGGTAVKYLLFTLELKEEEEEEEEEKRKRKQNLVNNH